MIELESSSLLWVTKGFYTNRGHTRMSFLRSEQEQAQGQSLTSVRHVPSHLLQSAYGYFFKYTIPKDLRETIDKTEIRYLSNTEDCLRPRVKPCAFSPLYK